MDESEAPVDAEVIVYGVGTLMPYYGEDAIGIIDTGRRSGVVLINYDIIRDSRNPDLTYPIRRRSVSE